MSLLTYGFPVNTCSYEKYVKSSLKIPVVTAIVALNGFPLKQLKLSLQVEALNLLLLQLIYPDKNNCMCFHHPIR